MGIRLSRSRREPHIVAGAIAAIVTLGLASGWGTSRILEERRAEIGEALATVLETTQQALCSWAAEHRAAAEVWASAPELSQWTTRLLAGERAAGALIASPAQRGIRELLTPVLETKAYLGFFVIAPDRTSLASSRDANIGTPNLLTRAQEQKLDRIFAGETILTSPQVSDVPLPDREGRLREQQPTMFVGAPIRDETGRVIAALTFRLDPGRAFTTILQRGRIGTSGETYAFDAEGRLISESRFDDQLRSIGLLDGDARGILHVEVRDPGRNLLRHPAAAAIRQDLPLTRMAASATAGESGTDLDGYRDYRGVSVIGAWLWDSDLDLGITTEIDRDEALATVRSARNVLLALTALAMGLVGGLAYLVMGWRRTAARLEDALTRVLSGFVPICAACKRIREEEGDWTAVEGYVRTHTGAEFTHTICPECERELYGDLI